jgi:hypothetical protein
MSYVKIHGKNLSWDEIYKICGLVAEDFEYDPEGSYDTLVEEYANYEEEE